MGFKCFLAERRTKVIFTNRSRGKNTFILLFFSVSEVNSMWVEGAPNTIINILILYRLLEGGSSLKKLLKEKKEI